MARIATPLEDMTDNVLSVEDIIARFEELEETRDDFGEPDNYEGDDTGAQADAALDEFDASEDGVEFAKLRKFLDEIKGYGGDHQWRGDWYPGNFISDSYFEEYAREYAEDMGALSDKAQWPYTCIDWERAATELQQDFAQVDLDGVTYWYRG